MPERFDFSFWPPRPIERSPITPAQTAPDEELCFDLALIPHQLLIARRALTTMYDDITKEDIDPWPAGATNDGKVIIAKVALRWHENFLENSLK